MDALPERDASHLPMSRGRETSMQGARVPVDRMPMIAG